MLDPIFVKPFPFNVVLFTPYKSTPSPLVQKGYATDRRWGCLAPGTVAQGAQHRLVDKNAIPRKVEKMHFQTVFKRLLRKNNFWNNSPSPALEARLMTPGISYGRGFSQLCRKKGQVWEGELLIQNQGKRVSRQKLSVRSPGRPGVLTSRRELWEAAAPKYRCVPSTPGFSSSSQILPKVEKAWLWSTSVNYVASPVSSSVGG